jgi:cardiolipin synthase
VKLIVEPQDGVAPLLDAIKGAKQSIDILIFRLDWKEIEAALKAAAGRGVVVRALIAYTNRGGTLQLRNLEARFLEAGIIVARTADDLIRYHGKIMIVDGRTLFLLSFNFTHMDTDHSRAFGIVTTSVAIVAEALRVFAADLNRQPFKPASDLLVVSPGNARRQLMNFCKGATTQLLIYDPKISDPQIMRLLETQAKAGVDVRIIGTCSAHSEKLFVTPLTRMRLHTRTIIRDGGQAFIGSQSLRPAELDRRREIGIIVHDRAIVKSLQNTFLQDWESTGFDELRDAVNSLTPAQEQENEKAVRDLAKAMPPLQSTLKNAIRQAVSKVGAEGLARDELKSTVKRAVKAAVVEAINEIAPGDL